MLTLENFTAKGIKQLQEFERDHNNGLREEIETAEVKLEMLKAELLKSNAQLRMLAVKARELEA